MTIKPRVELCVAGLVYFEVFVPGGMIPLPGKNCLSKTSGWDWVAR